MKNDEIIEITLKKGKTHYKNLLKNAEDFFAENEQPANESELKKISSLFMESVMLMSYLRLNIYNKMIANAELSKTDFELIDSFSPMASAVDILTQEMLPEFNFDNPSFVERIEKIAQELQDNADDFIENLFDDNGDNKGNHNVH